MIGLGLWLLVGIAVYAAAIWVNPKAYDTEGSDMRYDMGHEEVFMKTVATLLLWPLAILFYAANQFRKALLRAKKEKLKVRAEVEKELASARTEVEDLLRSVRR